MSLKIDPNAGSVQRQVFSYQRQQKASARPKKIEPKVNRDVSGGLKAGAKAALGGSVDLKRLADARKLSKPVDELTGIQDLNAHYYIHGGANRQVVQLREAKSSKLVRQVPDQDALERLTTMRRFARQHLDIVV